MRDALNETQWARDITGAPTAAVLIEYFRVWDTMQMVQLDPLSPDRYVWKWTDSGTYTASSAYRAFFLGRKGLPGATYIWNAAAPPKDQILLLVSDARSLMDIRKAEEARFAAG